LLLRLGTVFCAGSALEWVFGVAVDDGRKRAMAPHIRSVSGVPEIKHFVVYFQPYKNNKLYGS